jgi:hypothetical protein
MDTETNRDENLLVVVAVEEYARRHHLPAREVLSLFAQHDVIPLIRASYGALHTQDIYESCDFAEAVLERKQA